MRRRSVLIILVAALVLSACATRKEGPAPPQPVDEVHWSYEGDTGPDRWGGLSDDFRLCEEGQEQSPVDITSPMPADLTPIEFIYRRSAVNILNNGHTMQVNYDEGSSIRVEGQEFSLLQFHFHAESEHSVEGRTSPMELHLVHQAANEELAVIGVLLEEGAHNPAFDPVLENIPEMESEESAAPAATVHAARFLPEDPTYYRYEGSLTTPPCSEGVVWQVMAGVVELSGEQIEMFTTVFDDNSRPPQPLNEREVLRSEEP